jgi:hypothetical protein
MENPVTRAKRNVEHLPPVAPFELVRHDGTLALYVEVHETFHSASAESPGATRASFEALFAS